MLPGSVVLVSIQLETTATTSLHWQAGLGLEMSGFNNDTVNSYNELLPKKTGIHYMNLLTCSKANLWLFRFSKHSVQSCCLVMFYMYFCQLLILSLVQVFNSFCNPLANVTVLTKQHLVTVVLVRRL